jgi:hypothetical protein
MALSLLQPGATGHRVALLMLVLGESQERKKKMFLESGERADTPVLLFRGSLTAVALR